METMPTKTFCNTLDQRPHPMDDSETLQARDYAANQFNQYMVKVYDLATGMKRHVESFETMHEIMVRGLLEKGGVPEVSVHHVTHGLLRELFTANVTDAVAQSDRDTGQQFLRLALGQGYPLVLKYMAASCAVLTGGEQTAAIEGVRSVSGEPDYAEIVIDAHKILAHNLSPSVYPQFKNRKVAAMASFFPKPK